MEEIRGGRLEDISKDAPQNITTERLFYLKQSSECADFSKERDIGIAMRSGHRYPEIPGRKRL